MGKALRSRDFLLTWQAIILQLNRVHFGMRTITADLGTPGVNP
jgi:hypothetical protein